MNNMIKSMIGAARLDSQAYERVEADTGTTLGAVCVVVLASAAASIGIARRILAALSA